MADFTLPHLIYGTVTGGHFLRIIIKNSRTEDELETTTDIDGKYIVDAANWTDGYLETDTPKLVIDELPQHTENITTENGDVRLI